MKVVLLAGGFGTRISEESHLKPKPMIEIGEKPILWHIMKYYSQYGFHEFVICLGYKQYVVKEFFADYFLHTSDVTFDLANNKMEVHNNYSEPWKVTLVDTGLNTMTGGRVRRIRPFVWDEPFMLTYGDGVADVDIDRLLACHRKNRRLVTITTTQPEGRFGAIQIDGDGRVQGFKEKARKDQSWVNAGFMVMEPEVFDYLGDGSEMLENGPFERIAREGQMNAYRHEGFWSPMDTMHDKAYLEELWKKDEAPWKVYE